MEDVQLFAIELNTGGPNISEYGQLFLHGINAKGIRLDSIGGGYSPVTIEIKRLTGLPFDRVTLYQEGDLYKSWQFVQGNDGFILRADTIKDGEDLRDRWGTDFIGLADESIAILAESIQGEVINFILRSILS